jgi:17beta-estradiol 17-dehydrogenase / very-long-chain 3-oxoacyl-CoA reductase
MELIPILQANGPSLIMNLGSAGGLAGVPYITTYCSCKAFCHTYTLALKNEFAIQGLDKIDVVGYVIGNTTSASQ